jgi:hypothetical protein
MKIYDVKQEEVTQKVEKGGRPLLATKEGWVNGGFDTLKRMILVLRMMWINKE